MTAIVFDEASAATNRAPAAENKIHIWSTLAGVALFGWGFVLDFERSTSFLAWSTGCVAFTGYTIYLLFKNRIFLFSTLLSFLAYGVIIVWASNYVMELPMSSWRAGWESGSSFAGALAASFQYLTFFSILSNVAISRLPTHRIRPFAPLEGGYRMPVLLLTGFSGLALIVIAGTQARDKYLTNADIGTMFLVQASSIILATLFAFTLFFVAGGTFRNAVNTFLVAIALIVGLNGFRFLLIIFAFIFFFYILSTRKISTRWTVALIAVSVMGYFLLLILAYTRSVGMTFGGALAFAVQPDLNAAYGYVGAGDQTNLIAQDYYSEHSSEFILYGRTYIDAFFRLLPNIVHTTFFDTLRSQDYIIETGSFVPKVFRQSNWTIGSQLFVEAIINFGKTGPYIVLSVFAAALTLLERLARKSPSLFIGYVVTASMGYSLAWYGFANSLKQGMFAFVCSAIIIVAGKILVRQGIATPKQRRISRHLAR